MADPRMAAYSRSIINALVKLDEHFLNYLIVFEEHEEALRFAKSSPAYNRLKTDNFVALLTFIYKSAPKYDYGPGNPNNGLPGYELRMGNEFSRVVYVKYQKSSFPRITRRQWTEFGQKVATEGKAIGQCDEAGIHQNDDRFLTVRFWWD